VTQAAASTGLGPTAAAALERYLPPGRRIVDDDLARRILPAPMRAFLALMRMAPARNWLIAASERRTPGVWGGILCRKRYIDDKLVASVGQIDAMVNLGAGFDTRAYRLPTLVEVPVWEVDQPQNIAAKRDRLLAVFGQVPAHVRLVPVDFDTQDLGAELASSGYPRDARTFFVMEGVTQYLTEEGIRATFAFLAQSKRSRLVFTYVRKDFIEGRSRYGQERLFRQYVLPRTWLFGMDPLGVDAFLEPYGWRVVEHLGAEELAESYVKPTGRELATTPIERIVYAEHL